MVTLEPVAKMLAVSEIVGGLRALHLHPKIVSAYETGCGGTVTSKSRPYGRDISW